MMQPAVRTDTTDASVTFSHPDYTVGPGVTPDPGDFRRTDLPWDDRLPGRSVQSPQISPRGLYRRSGIGKFPSLTLPRRS